MANKYEDMSDDRQLPISDHYPEEDRGAPDLAAPKRGNKKKKVLILIGIIIFGLVCVFGIVFFLISQTSGNNHEEIPDKTLERDRVSTTNPLSEIQAKIEAENKRRREAELRAQREAAEARARKEKAEQNADRLLGQSSDAPPIGPKAPQTGSQQYAGKQGMTPEQRKLEGDVLLSIGGNGSASTNSKQGRERSSEIGDSLRGEAFSPGTARVLADLDMLLRRGTVIPCVIQNRIVSTYPSLSSCRITQDVYSADGSTVLIERGSVAYGEQKVALLQGQARLFVTWSDIDTASGVRVAIDSLGVDPLGASGVHAWVDNHFWDRFGGAIMLSFIDDGLEALASRLDEREDQNGVTFDSSTDNANDMAQTALENSINIKPTGYVKQGTRMSIRVARDVDFSNVYNVVRRP